MLHCPHTALHGQPHEPNDLVVSEGRHEKPVFTIVFDDVFGFVFVENFLGFGLKIGAVIPFYRDEEECCYAAEDENHTAVIAVFVEVGPVEDHGKRGAPNGKGNRMQVDQRIGQTGELQSIFYY